VANALAQFLDVIHVLQLTFSGSFISLIEFYPQSARHVQINNAKLGFDIPGWLEKAFINEKLQSPSQTIETGLTTSAWL